MSKGVIGGVEFLMPFEFGRTYVAMSLLLGYYSGKGDAFIDEDSKVYLSYGEFRLDGTRYTGDITVKGPYVALRGSYLMNERLTLTAGLKYEIYEYKYVSFEINNKYNGSISDVIQNRIQMALLGDYIFDRIEVREKIKTVDFSATYRLPFR